MNVSEMLVGIVVYKKRLETIKILDEISKSVECIDVAVFDNSPLSQEQQVISTNIIYFHDSNNVGVSAAYNHIFDYARSSNKKVVLLLDQDTEFSVKYLKVYLNNYQRYGDDYLYVPSACDHARTKIYSPARMMSFVGHVQKYVKQNSECIFSLNGFSVINSGLMIPIAMYDQINGFNEKIKLDFSDVYFIEKYKAINQSIVLVPIEMEHALSGDEQPDKDKELHRFKYYCNGAKELAISLHVSTDYTCLRRMIRLMTKYFTIQPVITYVKYYLGEEKV